MVKIFETADLRFGSEHGRFQTLSEKLKDERLQALHLPLQVSLLERYEIDITQCPVCKRKTV